MAIHAGTAIELSSIFNFQYSCSTAPYSTRDSGASPTANPKSLYTHLPTVSRGSDGSKI